jgi:hypothetical protein
MPLAELTEEASYYLRALVIDVTEALLVGTLEDRARMTKRMEAVLPSEGLEMLVWRGVDYIAQQVDGIGGCACSDCKVAGARTIILMHRRNLDQKVPR